MKTASEQRWLQFLIKCHTILSAFVYVAIIGLAEGKVISFKSTGIAAEQSSPLYLNVSDGCSYGLCLTTECVHTASMVLSKMDTDINPCNNFYQFACGKFINETLIPEDKSFVDLFSQTKDKLSTKLKAIVKEERPETDPKHLKLPNLLYQACMNTSLIEILGTKPIDNITNYLGGWPVVVGDSWDGNKTWSWEETNKKLRWLGFGTEFLISFTVGLDVKNNTKHIIYLDQPKTGLNRVYLVKGLNDTFVSAYYHYMVDIAVVFGAEKKAAEKELMQVLHFEIDLANITLPDEKRCNHTEFYNLRTIKQLEESYPFMKWLDYIKDFFSKDVNVNENEVVILLVTGFFSDLEKLLQRTKKRVIANYLMLRIHAQSISYLTEKLRERQLKFYGSLSGIQERPARWTECISAANKLPIALGSLYVRKHLEGDSKVLALEMVNNIRAAFSQTLEKVGWMDYTTTQEAKRKLDAIKPHIGYPDEMLDGDKLQEYHRNYEIDHEKYFESCMNIDATNINKRFSKLRMPVNKTDWTKHAFPAVVNAYYTASENSIIFPAGILQGHFFNAKRPRYMDYGGIGTAMGHEFTHGFDDQGKQYDADGNLINWWEAATQQAFLEKAQCIIDQYGNYTDKQTGLNLNGVKIQGENIADNGGTKQAYLAYNQWVAKNGEEPRLPGLNYTSKQMFWISAAQNWCAKYRPEALQNVIKTGAHPTKEFRVIGPLSNSVAFSHDFQCPVDAPMNPMHKCEVW